MSVPVIALPGGVMPAALRYAPLQAALGDQADFHFKDLEVYAGDAPPPGYSVATEVDALGRFADTVGLQRFHLVGYSGGGFVSLAFAGGHSDRLLSLALLSLPECQESLRPMRRRSTAGRRAHRLRGCETGRRGSPR